MQDKSRAINIVICQDSVGVRADAREIASLLGNKGYQLHITSVESQAELLDHLNKLKKTGKPGPDAVIMDVGGVGERAALKVVKWFDQNRPDQPLPALNFLSLSNPMAITEACSLRATDMRLQPSFIDSGELSWLRSHLDGYSPFYGLPESATFRQFLNDRLGTDLPLDHREDESTAKRMKQLKGFTNDRVLDAWINNKLTPAETLERMRAYATGVAAALRDGLYAQRGKTEGLESDARFYSSAGFPAKGKAVFSLDEVERAYRRDGQKPVLFMQSYDPAVVPVLASGKLGGLVVTSPYMASHLKLLCETHMVSGLFGMIPSGPKSLTSEFNEEARSDLPPYFSGGSANIAGKIVKQGQQVLVALGENGLVLSPPQDALAPADAPANADNNDKLRTDLRNLRQIERCFAAFFKSRGVPVHGVKANIDSSDQKVMRSANGIGLVRTEQMVATNATQLGYLKDYLLMKDERSARALFDDAAGNYDGIMRQLAIGKPVKIRLFDFVHREILNKQEQKQFVDRYGKLDVHGGEALDTWPDLYRRQAEMIFKAFAYSAADAELPVEIMMPAVRSEEDVLRIKMIVEQEAAFAGISPSQYSFGVMAETLEACRNIGAIAKHCDFISFGTNDLTSEFFDMSRSDLKAHAGFARKNGYDPFRKMAPEILDLMQATSIEGRKVNPSLRIDVCGAQAADPETAAALCRAGIDNVSVAPTLNNLYALPILMNYKLFDALQPQPAPSTVPPNTPENGREERSFGQAVRDFTRKLSRLEVPFRARLPRYTAVWLNISGWTARTAGELARRTRRFRHATPLNLAPCKS